MNTKMITSKEEKELMKLSEQEEWISVGSQKARRAFWKQAAQNTIEGKRTRISIAINDDDLARLKAEALRSGIPYQTLINSLIRRHVRS